MLEGFITNLVVFIPDLFGSDDSVASLDRLAVKDLADAVANYNSLVLVID